MDFKSVRKRIMGAKKASAKTSVRTRIERTVGVVLVVLMAAAAIMLAARKPEAVTSPAMTAKVVAPEETAPTVHKTTVSHADAKGSAPKNGNANAVVAAPVTITGCLEQDHDIFKLKDTDGTDAPQSRSWKSGFLKKRNSTIVVLDGSHRLKLDKHVGERVSVTGPVADKEMTARSLTRVAASCS